jgi:hypothetical protein
LENRSYLGVFYRFRGFGDYTSYGAVNPGLTLPYASKISSYPAQLGTTLRPWREDEVLHEPEGNGMYVQKSPQDIETYQTLEVRGNITLDNRWNLTFLLPYEFNRVYYRNLLDLPNPVRDTTMNLQGWGDLTLSAEYIHLIYNPKSRHTLRPGLALGLPTGQALVQAPGGEVYDPVIQPGRGSYSLTARLNYQWFLEKQGINAGLSYQWSTEGAQSYRFGQSLNAYLLYFRQWTLGKDWLAVPNMGLYLEQARQDQIQGIDQNLTGGTVGFGQLGLDFNKTQTTLSLLFQTPVVQDLNGNQKLNQSRWSIGMIRSFKL